MKLGLKKQVWRLNFIEDWSVTIKYVTFHVAKNKEVAIKFVCVKIPRNSHSGRVKRNRFRDNLALVKFVEPIKNTIYLKRFRSFVYV